VLVLQALANWESMLQVLEQALLMRSLLLRVGFQ
jgi:hypothetical protein